MSYNYLCIPIVVDALVLSSEKYVSAPMADFSQLPYNEEGIDYNANNPYTGETVQDSLWENKQMRLGPGVHLHWALPSGLTQSLPKSDGSSQNLAVPDQWLIVRTVLQSEDAVAKWVVESSYLYPPDAPTPNAITMPHYDGPARPFRYMGKQSNIPGWSPSSPEDYFEGLSAVGYGEPSFAGYYPNCYSVFGFYDDEPAQNGAIYTIIGVYRDSNADVLNQFVNQYDPNEGTDIFTAIEELFHWSVLSNPSGVVPNYCLCYGVIKIDTSEQSGQVNTNNAQITFGNNGTEAISAYLANKIAPGFKAKLEDQLESTLMWNFLHSNDVDAVDVFREARHTQNFNAIPGGTRWIVTKSQNNDIANAQTASAAARILLPDTMGEMLNRINILQDQYDKAVFSLMDKQNQLFSDWLKYIAATYPDIYYATKPDVNLIRWFIQTQSISSLQDLARNLGQFSIETHDDGKFKSANAHGSAHDSLAYRLSWALNGFAQRLQTLSTDNTEGVQFTLSPSEAPRYWQPTEPNILITGDVARPTNRYTGTEKLGCSIINATATPITQDENNHWGVNHTILRDILSICHKPGDTGYAVWNGQPWNPILLEWEIEVFALQSNQSGGTSNAFSNDFILRNYDLLNGAEDLSLKPGAGQLADSPLRYTGQSLLTPYASKIQYDALCAILSSDVMPTYLENKGLQDNDQTYLSDPANVQSLESWYLTTYLSGATVADIANDPYFSMIQALYLLETSNFLTQNLSGFNTALLQHESIFQTPLGDPLGSPTARDFTTLVATYVGQSNHLAPLPQSPFLPIRSGEFRLITLKIVDTFGQAMTLDPTNVITTENMKGDAPNLIHLQPRVVQPARLQFRWLSANDTTVEMNDMPDTQAICGWLVPNHLDKALLVFNAEGKTLGEIVPSADAVLWVPAPNSSDAIYDITRISNIHLQKTVTYLLAQDPVYLNALLETIADAQGTIDPSGYESFSNRIFFIGQPIAIIRALVGIEVMGETAVDQSWDALRTDFNRNHTRSTAGVEDIRFPARLGKYEHLNDGLIGYWVEDHGSLTDTLYAPQSYLDVQNDKIKTLGNAEDTEFYLPLSVSGEPVFTTILMDPRANVHATSGILPAKVINIPPSTYSLALSKMEMTFLNAPIMMHTNATEIALPAEAGYRWSWMERQRNGWQIVNQSDILTPRAAAVFSGPQRIVEGWLKLSKSDS